MSYHEKTRVSQDWTKIQSRSGILTGGVFRAGAFHRGGGTASTPTSGGAVNGLDSYGLTLPCQSLAKGSYLFLGVLRI